MSGEKLYRWGSHLNKTETIQNEQKIDENFMKIMTVDQNILVETGMQNQNKNKPVPDERMTEAADEVLEEKRENVRRNMPKQPMLFSGKMSFIKNANYVYISDNEEKMGTKNKPSKKYMKPVLDNLQQLDDMLERPFDMGDSDAIQEKFKELVLACEYYLRKRNPWSDEGKARKQMIRDIYDQARVESMRFSTRIEQMKADPEAGMQKTWLEVLKEVRTQKFVDGADGVKVTVGGAGTSKVYIVEKDKKKFYFKENEKIPSDNFVELMGNEVERLRTDYEDFSADNTHSEEEKKACFVVAARRQKKLDKVCTALCRCFRTHGELNDFLDEYRKPSAMYNAVIKELDGRHDNYINEALRTLTDDENEVSKLKEEYEKINNDYNAAKDSNADNEAELLQRLKEKEKEIKECDYTYISETILQMSKNIRCHGIARNDACIEDGAELSKRNVATARLARLLGVNNADTKLIAESSLADVVIDGKYMQGIVMEEAPGKDIATIKQLEAMDQRQTKYSPDAFREILTLQIFDIIIGQVDRNGSNYLGRSERKQETDVTEITHITGIDNDMCGGILYYNDIHARGSKGLNRMRNIEVNRKLQVPGIDREFAQRIKDITPEMIHHEFCDILNKDERKALIDRIKGVKKVITKLETKDRKNARNKDYKSRFISRWDKAGWADRLKEYGDTYRRLKERDKENANKRYIALVDSLNARLNDMTEREKKIELDHINKKYKALKNRTDEELKSATYLRGDYL